MEPLRMGPQKGACTTGGRLRVKFRELLHKSLKFKEKIVGKTPLCVMFNPVALAVGALQ